MTYQQALDHLQSTRVFGWKLGLDTMRALLGSMGNPQAGLKFIHIAGTNGKGSVAAMSQSMLTAAGYKTALYTSPHLVSLCERFQIDGRLIEEADVARLVAFIRPLAERVAADPRFRDPTLFELVTAMALQYFREQRVEVIAWETGLGGRLDATNIVTPLVSVITNIGFDHVQHLGETIAEIAREKCGIIKPGVPVVTAARRPAALAVIRSVCAERGCPLTVVEAPATLPVPLLGEHQGWNCATALAALRAAGYTLSPAQQQHGLQQITWPGRFQVLAGTTPVVVDGAHNVDATHTLLAALTARFPGRPVTLVLGVLRDKAYPELCRLLAPVAQRVICVPVKSERTSAPGELAQLCQAANPQAAVTVAADVPAALALARATPLANEVLLITGSLFLVGEALRQLELPFGLAQAQPRELKLQ